MKLTVAVVAALSAGKALAFVPSSSFGSTSTIAKASSAAQKCSLRMNAAGEEGATTAGTGTVVAEQQPMGRKQMLQSVAATGLGAILFGAQATPSFAADVDYSKVCIARAGGRLTRSFRELWVQCRAVSPDGHGSRNRCLCACSCVFEGCKGGCPSRSAAAAHGADARGSCVTCWDPRKQAIRYAWLVKNIRALGRGGRGLSRVTFASAFPLPARGFADEIPRNGLWCLCGAACATFNVQMQFGPTQVFPRF